MLFCLFFLKTVSEQKANKKVAVAFTEMYNYAMLFMISKRMTKKSLCTLKALKNI